MVMVVTVPLRQPCTTAWSYVHNGFRAAGEGPHAGLLGAGCAGVCARLPLVFVGACILSQVVKTLWQAKKKLSTVDSS